MRTERRDGRETCFCCWLELDTQRLMGGPGICWSAFPKLKLVDAEPHLQAIVFQHCVDAGMDWNEVPHVICVNPMPRAKLPTLNGRLFIPKGFAYMLDKDGYLKPEYNHRPVTPRVHFWNDVFMNKLDDARWLFTGVGRYDTDSDSDDMNDPEKAVNARRRKRFM